MSNGTNSRKAEAAERAARLAAEKLDRALLRMNEALEARDAYRDALRVALRALDGHYVSEEELEAARALLRDGP